MASLRLSPLDEPHGVIGPAVAIVPQAVDRHDARVLQPAGDLGLQQEPLAADPVVGVVVEDLLQRHLAVQLGVQRHEDGAQAAPGMGPQHAEPLAVAGGRADGVGGGAVGIAVVAAVEAGPSGPSVPLDLGSPTWPGSRGSIDRRGCAARLRPTSPPCFLMWQRPGLDRGAVLGIEVAAVDEVVGQRRAFRASRPGRRPRAGPDRSGRSARRADRRGGRVGVGGHRWVSRPGAASAGSRDIPSSAASSRVARRAGQILAQTTWRGQPSPSRR